MDWTQGYAATWRVRRIDPATWEPCGVLEGVESIDVSTDGSDNAPLLETASMTVTCGALQAFEPGWYRIVMEAVQGFSSEAVAVSTVWLEAGKGSFDRGFREDSLEGRSTLCQAADAVMGDGGFAPRGADGAAWAGARLAEHIDAPVHVEGAFTLPDHVVFDLDSSVLAAVWDVLHAGNFVIQLDGRGEVHVRPMPTVAALSLDRAGACAVMPKVGYSGIARTYTREYAPGIRPYSVVYGALPERGLDGLYRVTSQKYVCGKGLTVEETVEGI